MGENICKRSNGQRINLQNIQAAHATQYNKNKQPNQKICGRPKQTFLQRRHTDGQQTHEKMLNITNYQRNTNQNYEVSLHAGQNGCHKKKSTNSRCWRRCGEKRTILHCWWEGKLIQPLWRTVWRFLENLKIELPYDPATPLLGIYPEKTIIQKDTCTPMFTAALFTIAKTWKQLKCPSTEEQIKKMWHIYTMEYNSAIKRNEIESFVEMWMDLETVIQSEVSQKEKTKYRILMHICAIQKNGIDDLI